MNNACKFNVSEGHVTIGCEGSQENLEREILRIGIIAELDAVNLYEQMAFMTKNPLHKKVFLDIAKEEKTHVGEFQALLLKVDEEHSKELEMGQREIDELKKEGF